MLLVFNTVLSMYEINDIYLPKAQCTMHKNINVYVCR